jgi:hypothetical protein
MTTLNPVQPRNPLERFVAAAAPGNLTLWRSALVMLALMVVCLVLHGVDPRLIDGANVWDKPAKFFLSLAVHFITVSWAIGLLAPSERSRGVVVWLVRLMVAAGWIELAYIVARAARGEASHFNTETPLDGALYTIMGVGAVTLTVTTAIIGFHIWRKRDGIWTEAAAIGLMLGAVLGTVAGAYLSSQSGHWVGGELSDANGLGFFRWSTTGGDLRVAHFVGLHAVQFVPLAAMTGSRRAVYATAIAITALTGAVFLQALVGIPLLRA